MRQKLIELEIDRRGLLRMGLSAGLLAALPAGCVRLRDGDASVLLEIVGDAELPIDPERVGEASDSALDDLIGLCDFVDRGWELGAEMERYRDRLRADLRVKTVERPSYLSEYESAARLVRIVRRESASPDQAWATLLFSKIDSRVPEQTRLGRARRLVFGEIVTHQVALSGGFRSFGVVNYTGWAGGPFADELSFRRGGSGE